MSWLRLDDKFPHHPKFDGWTPTQRWAWLELMAYCARYETCGQLPEDLSLLPRSVNQKLLNKAATSGWIDIDEDGTKHIHDWEKYNPKDPLKQARQQRWRRRKRDTEVDAPVDGGVDADVDALARAPAGASPSRPETPIGGGGTEGPRSAVPLAPNGPGQLSPKSLGVLAAYVHREWDNYPNPVDLHLELTDRGASNEQATDLIESEERSRS